MPCAWDLSPSFERLKIYDQASVIPFSLDYGILGMRTVWRGASAREAVRDGVGGSRQCGGAAVPVSERSAPAQAAVAPRIVAVAPGLARGRGR